jgi:hypothetical protein
MMSDLKSLRNRLGEADAKLLDYLITGVAYKNLDKKIYEVISHEGDWLVDLTIFQVENLIARLRRLGFNPANVNIGSQSSPYPGFTVAWSAEYQAKPRRWISVFNWLQPSLLISV